MSQMQIGERTFTIGCIRDISGRKAYTEALEHRTLHDDLTGLPNRALFGDRMDRALADAERADEPRGVLLVDVDGFRMINETLGRDNGDVVLKTVAERLQTAVRNSDTVARMGGDEFGILASDETDVETAEAIAWKVRAAFEEPFLIAGEVLNVRASIGIAFFPQHGRTTADLMRRASLAMRQAKQAGGGVGVFIAEPEDPTARRLTLLSELREGIPRGELVLHYQPKVDLTTPQDDRGRGARALAAPHRRAADARAVHARGGAQRADRAADDLGARRGPAPAARVARRRHRADDGGQHLGAQPDARQRAPGHGGAAHRHLGRRARHADPRADGERPDRRRGPGRPRAPARDGRAGRDRRLRHRPFVARLPPAAADRRDQGRPLVRHEPRHRLERRRDRALHDRPRPQPRPHGRRRGRRGRGRARHADRVRLRQRAGLPVQPARARPRSSPPG